MQQVIEQFRQKIARATDSGVPLRIEGGGTKQWHGRAVPGEPLDTRAYHGIIDYDPSELVITARCGTPLAELETRLAEHGQMLGCEPPRAAGATVGGTFASGLAGPRRPYAGALRDFTLGATLMDGRGEIQRFGGRVIKNVAGYDVSRLLAGSLGTLGLVLEVSLKVVPRPAHELTLRFDLAQDAALARLTTWRRLPLPISASCWVDGTLSVRLSGAAAAVQGGRKALGGEEQAQGGDLWQALRDLRHGFQQSRGNRLWRLALPPTTPPLLAETPQLIEWGGGQRWLASDLPAQTLRSLAAQHGGHATLFRGSDRDDVFHPLPPHLAVLHRRLKAAFDPAGLFNPGRLYQDL